LFAYFICCGGDLSLLEFKGGMSDGNLLRQHIRPPYGTTGKRLISGKADTMLGDSSRKEYQSVLVNQSANKVIDK